MPSSAWRQLRTYSKNRVSPNYPVSILTLILIGIALIASAALIALIHAVANAEEGYEDATGYHRLQQSKAPSSTTSANVDTGNPWDQIEGASCPLNLSQPFRPLGQGDFSTHLPSG